MKNALQKFSLLLMLTAFHGVCLGQPFITRQVKNEVAASHSSLSKAFSEIGILYTCKKFPGYIAIAIPYGESAMLVEVGGTSLKMRSELMMMTKEHDVYKPTHSTARAEYYMIERNGKFHLYYHGTAGRMKFKLRPENNPERVDEWRFIIFHHWLYWHQEAKKISADEDFKIYKADPAGFLKDI